MLRRAKSKPLTRLPVALDSMKSRALADDANVWSMSETRLSSTVGDLLHLAARVVSSMMQVGCSLIVPLGRENARSVEAGWRRHSAVSIFLDDAPQLVIGIGCSGRPIPNPQAEERQQEKCPEHGHASFRIVRLKYLHGAPPFRALPVIQTRALIARGNKAGRSRRKEHNRRGKLSP